MGEKTNITWCDHTFNPWIGCTKVSPGCANCYAERENNFHKWNKDGWGDDAPRVRTSEKNWQNPIKWAKQAVRDGVTRRVFCASLADVFDPLVPFEWLVDLWKLVSITQEIGGLEWLILTKRPENIATRVPTELTFPTSCIRMGVTAENQEMADLRILELLRSWQGKNFVSYEPALGAIDFTQHLAGYLRYGYGSLNVQWLICGGESGPDARSMHPDWARSTRDQCRAAGVPFFFKQWGEWLPDNQLQYMALDTWMNKEREVEGGFYLVGKKKAGDLLDGVEWKQFPEVVPCPK